MRLYDIKGRLVSHNSLPYLIDWKKPSRSKLQFRVKQFLKTYWGSHVVFEEFPVYGSQMKVDILNATTKVAIEVNGQQHGKFIPFFHGKHPINFLKSIKRDSGKREWLESNGYILVDIEYNEVDDLNADFFKRKYDIIL